MKNGPERNTEGSKKARKERVQLNIETSEKVRNEAQLCAMLDKITAKEWLARVIEQATARTLAEKGIKSPFDQPATPFRVCAVG